MRKRLLALAALLALAGIGALARESSRPHRGYSGNLIIEIKAGTRAPDVARLLVERGVLAHRLPFLARYWLGRPWHGLKAGEYLFDRRLSPLEVCRKLVQGDVLLYLVVIPEGSDRFDMTRILHEQLGVDPDEFLRATHQTSAIRDLDAQAPTLEGYLYPDTYRFPRGVSPRRVIETMLSRFRKVFDAKFRQELGQSRANLRDVVTLASMVEKETPGPSERAMIAGVFARRLEKGWPLQCDPTVVYAARLEGRPIGPITQGDLSFDSPYNTYRYRGLPPGPISSPGEASIRAALNPAPGKSFYFVSNNQGGHFFARTLAEHMRNVARYRREIAALRRAARKARRWSEQASLEERRGGNDATASSTKSGKNKK